MASPTIPRHFPRLGQLSTKIPLQEAKAAHGQALLIGFAFCNQALKVSLEFGKLPLKVTDDPHEVAGFLDALDRFVENAYLRIRPPWSRTPPFPCQEITMSRTAEQLSAFHGVRA
jgi:hypothetical protein